MVLRRCPRRICRRDASGFSSSQVNGILPLRQPLIIKLTHYRKFLCNHHFNRAMALRDLARGAEAVAAISEGCRLLPLDPEQWHRKARILASVSGGPDAAQAAILALRRSIELGIEDAAIAIGHHDLVSIRTQPEYIALVKEIEQKKRSAMSQHP